VAARAGLALLIGAAVSHAQAQSEAVHLSWVRAPGAESCGDAGHVQADVMRRLGRDPFSEPSRFFIEATVTRSGVEWRAELALREAAGDSLGSRTVTSDAASCASLVSAAGLAIALMIDPDAGHAAAPPAPPPPPASRSKPKPPRAGLVRSAAPAAEVRGGIMGAVAGAARILPEPALGLRVGGELGLWAELDLALSLSFFAQQRERLRGFDVSFGLTYASLGPCYRFVDAARVQLAGCAAFSLGAMHAVTFEPERGRTSELRWTAASLGAQAAWLLVGPVTLRGGVEAVVPLEQHEYVIVRGDSERVSVFSDPVLAATAHLGLGGRF
jgi:hypothetical protein